MFRMAVGGKIELIVAVHILIAGSNETRRYFYAVLVTKFPTNNLSELTWYPS